MLKDCSLAVQGAADARHCARVRLRERALTSASGVAAVGVARCVLAVDVVLARQFGLFLVAGGRWRCWLHALVFLARGLLAHSALLVRGALRLLALSGGRVAVLLLWVRHALVVALARRLYALPIVATGLWVGAVRPANRWRIRPKGQRHRQRHCLRSTQPCQHADHEVLLPWGTATPRCLGYAQQY